MTDRFTINMSNATSGSINFSQTATGFSDGTIQMFENPTEDPYDSNHQITSTNTEITFESTEPSPDEKSALNSFFDDSVNIFKQYSYIPPPVNLNSPNPQIMVISKKKADGTQSFSTAYPEGNSLITSYLNTLGADYFIMFKWFPPFTPTSFTDDLPVYNPTDDLPKYKYFKSPVETIITVINPPVPVEEAITPVISIGNQNKTETEEARKALDSIKNYMKSIISDNYVKNLTPEQLKNDLSFIKEWGEDNDDENVWTPLTLIQPNDIIWEENDDDDDEIVSWYKNETNSIIKKIIKTQEGDDYYVVDGTNEQLLLNYESGNIRELDKETPADMKIIIDFILTEKFKPQYAAIDKLITSTTTSTSAPVSAADGQHKQDLLDIYKALSALTKPK